VIARLPGDAAVRLVSDLMKTNLSLLLGLLAGAFLFVGCPVTDDDDSAEADDDYAVLGSWIDGFGVIHVISETLLISGSLPSESRYTITQFDADGRWAVGQNHSDNLWGADLWSRFEWTKVDDQVWYCQVAYAEASEADALAVDPADPTDPATTGCGGFPWSTLDSHPGPLATIGQYNDSGGFFHAVFQDAWHMGSLGAGGAVFTFSQYDNEEGWAIAQNHAGNAWFPGLWSRFDWIVSAGDVWFCQTEYEAADEATALAAPAPDATDPAASGCGGFSWSNLGVDHGVISLAGSYTDQWGSDHVVAWGSWTQDDSSYALTRWNSAEGWAVGQNASENDFNPDLWSRFDWAEVGGSLWYCQTNFAADTEATAEDTPAADPSDPATTGCDGFAWTNLTP
jgi:hypothetical protein